MHNPEDRSFIGHPRGLAYIVFTEAWERFSYYGMQSLLVLYMVNRLLHPGISNTSLDSFHFVTFWKPLIAAIWIFSRSPLQSSGFTPVLFISHRSPAGCWPIVSSVAPVRSRSALYSWRPANFSLPSTSPFSWP